MRRVDGARPLRQRAPHAQPNRLLVSHADDALGRGGKMIRVQTGENGELIELVARYAPGNPDQLGTHFTRLTVKRISGKLYSTVETAPLAAQVRMGSGTVQSSLFAATDEARIQDNVATQLTDAYLSIKSTGRL